MRIVKEKTRIMFLDYNPAEKRVIENIVATIDDVFAYEDPDDKMIAFPPGMEDTVRKVFKNITIEDKSNAYWDYAAIQPVQHSAKPRNQLQINFIKYVIEHANKKEKVAGILSPGTGKAISKSTPLPTPNGYKLMGEIEVGDYVFTNDGTPTMVDGVFPQGALDVYKLTFSDGRTARCSLDHLWAVDVNGKGNLEILTLKNILEIKLGTMDAHFYIPTHSGVVSFENITHEEKYNWLEIISIKFDGKEDCQCIHVTSASHLFLTENFIVTHNTFMACYCAIQVGLRTLIIAPTSSIKQQWADTLTGMFKVDPSRVKVIHAPKDFINVKEDFVVASQASLAVLNKRYDLEKIMKDNKFGIKVIDEVQMWFKNIINVDANCNFAHNWYLTGTFGRSGEDENKLYQHMFGDLSIFREEEKKPTIFNPRPGNIYGMKPHTITKMIWMHSGLSKKEIKSVMGSMRYSERSGKWMRYGISVNAYANLILPRDGTMTKYLSILLEVIKQAEREVSYGRTLILVPTIAASEMLLKYVTEMFPKKMVVTIHSHHSTKENLDAKAKADIMISTPQSAGTGFDAKGLSKLIVSSPFKSWILGSQIRGRLRRRDDGKDTFMWDIIDADIPQLRAWANARANVYRKESKSFKVVDM